MIGIFLHHRPAFLLGAQAAQAQLVGDGSIALVVGGIAGVECDSHARASLIREAVARLSGRLLLDEIACSLACELADKIDEAGGRFAGLGNTRDGFSTGLGDQAKRSSGGLSLPSHSRPIS
ncbi:MAG: hypothetical protein QM699_16000 [Amaricoccus sp.]|uniref:hypothetical protein n=1 Tax=Amaricoccus sp. TaxID=1872485 RepID=UPI0039E69558